jgi:hypothetical protein
MWRMDTLFRGTELLLAEVGYFQQRSYGPSSLVSMAPLRQWSVVTSLPPRGRSHSAETAGHFPPRLPVTSFRNGWTLSSETGGHFRPSYTIVEYEPDSDLRDTEQVPLLEDSGIEAFICREVLPYTPDAWIKGDATRTGYEVSFTRHFYKPQPLRTLEEIGADILAIEKEAEGLLDGLLKVPAK